MIKLSSVTTGAIVMKIFFKQSDVSTFGETVSPLASFGITECYVKQLYISSDSQKVTRKTHHHNGFEIHIIEKGHQEYDIDGKVYAFGSGEFLFIPPFVKHRILYSTPETAKFSLTFSSDRLTYMANSFSDRVPSRFFENMRFIIAEKHYNKHISERLIENSVFESAVLFLRLAGLKERKGKDAPLTEDHRLAAAKEYIRDNIESPLTVTDIAGYCYVSAKQITRIFMKHEGITPAQYIINQRIAHIQQLLSNNSLSLTAISDTMGFQNVYYFNTFVKKHLGMPPGTYRKMMLPDK